MTKSQKRANIGKKRLKGLNIKSIDLLENLWIILNKEKKENSGENVRSKSLNRKCNKGTKESMKPKNNYSR